MKAFLVYPEFTRRFRYADWLEIGVAAAMLRQIGWEVSGFYWKSPRLTDLLKRRFGEHSPDLAVTVIHPDQAHQAVAINRHIKSHRPQTVTLACGLWPTLAPDAVIASKVFDALILAEWEPALTEFAIAFQDQRDYTQIRNFWVKKRPSEVRRLPIRPPVDLDSLPPADRDLFPYPQVLQINGGELPLQASRSCIYHCAFCQEPVLAAVQHAGPNPHRARSPERVIDEAADLALIFSPKRIHFVDQLFPWDERWLEPFAERWRTDMGLPFTVTTVVEACQPRALDLLRHAGCDQVVLGIETGDEAFRRTFCNRNLGNQAILDFRRALYVRGMNLITTNMLGAPGETPQTLEATLRFNQELQPSAIRCHVFDPLPQTPLARYLEQHKIEVKERESDALDPDISRLRHSKLSQKQISQAFDRLCLLDSVLRSRRRAGHEAGFFDLMAHFADGRYRSPWRRAARLTTWKLGAEARQVLALRAPTEITFDFTARPHSAFSFGVTVEPALRGLRPHQSIQFGIKIAQDKRTYRLFKKVLVPALDPDARRWHDYLFPLRDIRPGPCRIILQVHIADDELKKLAPDEEIWGGWSSPHVLDHFPSAQPTSLPMHGGEAAGGKGELIHTGERVVESSRRKPAADDSGIVLPLRDEHVVSLELPSLAPSDEREALIRHMGDLASRIQHLETQLNLSEAEKLASIRRVQEAEVRAARAEEAFRALRHHGPAGPSGAADSASPSPPPSPRKRR